MKVGVLGLGNWGTALAQHFASCGFEILAYTPVAETVESINKARRHNKYLTSIMLDSKIVATSNLEELSALDLVCLALPAKALAEVFQKFRPSENVGIISAIKGLEPNSLMTPLHFLKKKLFLNNDCAVLSGPSFASDVASGLPVGLVAASESEIFAEKIATSFSNLKMKIYISSDPIGVEIGGIAKNIIAIAAGVSDALQLGDSARAGLITRGLSEITRLAVALGADARTLAGLSGLGDLVLTATSDLSRNRTVGLRLGAGESLPSILKSLGSTSEGVSSAPILMQLAKEHGVEMPITEHVSKLLSGDYTPQEMTQSLLMRPVKKEVI